MLSSSSKKTNPTVKNTIDYVQLKYQLYSQSPLIGATGLVVPHPYWLTFCFEQRSGKPCRLTAGNLTFFDARQLNYYIF